MLVIGVMGWLGLPINIATAMIASVSMGLTVDSSIHYISGYRRARQAGLGVVESLRETHRGVGRALVFANLALIVGFSVLTQSHFIPLIYFGILVSVSRRARTKLIQGLFIHLLPTETREAKRIARQARRECEALFESAAELFHEATEPSDADGGPLSPVEQPPPQESARDR